MTPAEIAAKLTPAQVRALTRIGESPTLGRFQNASTTWALSKKGLLENLRLTPLGQAVLAAIDEGAKCPRCGSTAPHMHPAVQHEGEVEICTDAFHLTPTAQNTPAYIASVLAKRAK